MTQKVLDVGNCDPDHSSIKRMLTSRYDVEVLRAHALEDALEQLQNQEVALILINRKLDCDYTDGVDVLKGIKEVPEFQTIPIMIVTNYPEHQDIAVGMGAEYGFGKLQLEEAATHDRLGRFLAMK